MNKAVVIGCGSIGTRYIRLLIDLKFSVNCHDIKKIDTSIFKDNVINYDSISKCIDCNPDIIIISTPPSSHLSCLVEAIKSNAKILLEKPIASSKKDSDRILEIDKKNKGRIWCVSNMRYHPGFIAIKNNIKKVGKVYYANSYFSHKLSQMRKSSTKIFASNKNEGGVILDCVHDIDLISNLFGKIIFVNSWIASIGLEKIDAEDHAYIWLKNESGVRLSMHFDFLSRWKTRGIKVVGENGTLIWESCDKSPELISVKLYDTNGLAEILIENFYLPTDLVYKEMLNDFISEKKYLQTVNEASKILDLALKARMNENNY